MEIKLSKELQDKVLSDKNKLDRLIELATHIQNFLHDYYSPMHIVIIEDGKIEILKKEVNIATKLICEDIDDLNE